MPAETHVERSPSGPDEVLWYPATWGSGFMLANEMESYFTDQEKYPASATQTGAPGGTSSVMTDPAAVYAPSPTSTGATNIVSTPVLTPSPMVVRDVDPYDETYWAIDWSRLPEGTISF